MVNLEEEINSLFPSPTDGIDLKGRTDTGRTLRAITRDLEIDHSVVVLPVAAGRMLTVAQG